MKGKIILIAAVIIILIINSSKVLAQSTPEEQDKLRKRGLDFPEGSNIRVEGDSVILNQGADVSVSSVFSGTIKGGSGGGRVTVQGVSILLMQDSSIKIENGKIVVMENVNLEQEISLEGHKIKGNLIDYENGEKITAKNVRAEIAVYPRYPKESDPIVPVYFTKGHISSSENSMRNLISKSSIQQHPIYGNLGGCSNVICAIDIASTNPDHDLRFTATGSTGKGQLNNLLAVGLIKSFEEGITDAYKQEEFIRGYVMRNIKGNEELEGLFEHYSLPIENSIARIQ